MCVCVCVCVREREREREREIIINAIRNSKDRNCFIPATKYFLRKQWTYFLFQPYDSQVKLPEKR